MQVILQATLVLLADHRAMVDAIAADRNHKLKNSKPNTFQTKISACARKWGNIHGKTLGCVSGCNDL